MPDKRRAELNDEKKSGVTLVEILIVTVIISLMASIAFPVYKLMQQREKERRLKKILTDVRTALAGSKSQLSTTSFNEGVRTYLRVKGIEIIKNSHDLTLMPENAIASAAIATFTLNLARNGLGYPPTPNHITCISKYDVVVATGPTALAGAGTIKITVDRRFLRTIPPHPFQGWYPNATWTFQPAYSTTYPRPAVASSAWATADGGSYYGVTDIRSNGAGMALDGSNTDDW